MWSVQQLGYRPDDRGVVVHFPARTGHFFLHYNVHTGCAAHPASYPTVTRALAPRIKRPDREGNHSLPSNTEANKSSHTCTSPCAFLSCTQTQTFTITLAGARNQKSMQQETFEYVKNREFALHHARKSYIMDTQHFRFSGRRIHKV
jgi:hypothetical protein